jgi:hypothetical protein
VYLRVREGSAAANPISGLRGQVQPPALPVRTGRYCPCVGKLNSKQANAQAKKQKSPVELLVGLAGWRRVIGEEGHESDRPHRAGRTERAPSADVLGCVSACVPRA